MSITPRTSGVFRNGQAGRTLSQHLARSICTATVLFGTMWNASAASPDEQELRAVFNARSDFSHGEELFSTCAACHRSDGSGTADGTVPAIAAQPFRAIAKQLVDFRGDQRSDERMQHFSDQHHLKGAQDIADVAAYISRLPPTPSLGQGPGILIQQGSKVYARSCATCHGPAAQGSNGSMSPRLAGQHYGYLLRQISDAIAGRRPNFTSAHEVLLERFDQKDWDAVAAYLSRLGPSEQAPHSRRGGVNIIYER